MRWAFVLAAAAPVFFAAPALAQIDPAPMQMTWPTTPPAPATPGPATQEMDRGAMDHATMDHGAMQTPETPAPTPLYKAWITAPCRCRKLLRRQRPCRAWTMAQWITAPWLWTRASAMNPRRRRRPITQRIDLRFRVDGRIARAAAPRARRRGCFKSHAQSGRSAIRRRRSWPSLGRRGLDWRRHQSLRVQD
jgi:hypothetical protein